MEHSTSTSSDKLGQKSTKIRFEYEDDDQCQDNELPEETATESSNLEEDVAMCEQDPDDSSMTGGDKTSADYYFDSYSHFGKAILVFFTFIQFYL